MKDIRIACFSDIHLGHRDNDTVDILNMLSTEIFEKNLLSKIDLLIFAGDIFDRLLQLDYPALAEIDYWFAKLFRHCSEKNVLIRVLEGTPRHDRGQPKRLETIWSLTGSTCDFLYVDTLKIERIDRFDMQVLYIPDEYLPRTDQILEAVQMLYKEKGIEQVDIAIMHGQFEYQAPVGVEGIPVHNSEIYQKLVKTAIFIGHVHTHSRRGKIVAQGSFDRLRHGEEEPKGYVYANIKNGKAQFHFIENKQARIYKTVQVYGLDTEQTSLKIKQALLGMPLNTCLRIEAEPTHAIFANIAELARQYPTIRFTKLAKDRTTGVESITPVSNEFTHWQPVSINKNNIEELVMERLARLDLSPESLEYARKQLQECL